MKHSSLYLPVAMAIIFACLFYHQTLGLNILIWSALLILLMFGLRKRFDRSIVCTSVLFLASSCSVFVFCNALSALCWMLIMAFCSGQIVFRNRPAAFVFLPGGLNLLTAAPYAIFAQANRRRQADKTSSIPALLAKFIIIGLVLFVFILLYRNSSAGFAKLTDAIQIDVPHVDFFLLLVPGFMIATAFLRHAGKSLLRHLLPPSTETIQEKEKKSTVNWLSWGKSLLLCLNILIIVVIISDLWFVITELGPQRSPAFYSESVHEGVGALIFSSILAMLILFIFFEGRINFIKGSAEARQLAYVWIACNICLLGLTFYKNAIYISQLGMTYKRIGVYYYLAIFAIGLCLMYFKIRRDMNFRYILHRAIPIYLVIALISSFVPWELVVTKHNLEKAKYSRSYPDFDYLLSLEGRNLHLLQDYASQYAVSENHLTEIETRINDYKSRVQSKGFLSLVLAEQWSLKKLSSNTHPVKR